MCKNCNAPQVVDADCCAAALVLKCGNGEKCCKCVDGNDGDDLFKCIPDYEHCTADSCTSSSIIPPGASTCPFEGECSYDNGAKEGVCCTQDGANTCTWCDECGKCSFVLQTFFLGQSSLLTTGSLPLSVLKIIRRLSARSKIT